MTECVLTRVRVAAVPRSDFNYVLLRQILELMLGMKSLCRTRGWSRTGVLVQGHGYSREQHSKGNLFKMANISPTGQTLGLH